MHHGTLALAASGDMPKPAGTHTQRVTRRRASRTSLHLLTRPPRLHCGDCLTHKAPWPQPAARWLGRESPGGRRAGGASASGRLLCCSRFTTPRHSQSPPLQP